MAVKTVEMVRKIRDKHYEATKGLSFSEQVKFIKERANTLSPGTKKASRAHLRIASAKALRRQHSPPAQKFNTKHFIGEIPRFVSESFGLILWGHCFSCCITLVGKNSPCPCGRCKK